MTWLPNNIFLALIAVMVLGLLHAQIGTAAATLKNWANNLWTWSSEVFRQGKPLDLAVKQAAGALFMTGAGSMVAYSEWLLALATLAPMFGQPSTQDVSDMDWLLGGALVLSGVVFFIVRQDSTTNGSFSLYATMPRARAATYRVACNLFWFTIVVGVMMAVYRIVVFNLEQLLEWGVNPLWVDALGMTILVQLAIIFLWAVAYCFTHLESVATLAVSLVSTTVAAVLGALWILLSMVAAVGEGLGRFSDGPKKLLVGLGNMLASIGRWFKKQWQAFRQARQDRKKQKNAPVEDLTRLDVSAKNGKYDSESEEISQPRNPSKDARQTNDHPMQNGHESVYIGAWGRSYGQKVAGVSSFN